MQIDPPAKPASPTPLRDLLATLPPLDEDFSPIADPPPDDVSL